MNRTAVERGVTRWWRATSHQHLPHQQCVESSETPIPALPLAPTRAEAGDWSVYPHEVDWVSVI